MKPDQTLPTATLHILLVLNEGERHGYSIAKEISAQTQGKMNIGPGTLYGAIKRLLEQGLIQETPHRPEGDDPRRCYYRISPHGQSVLHDELHRLMLIVGLPSARRILSAGGTA